MLRTCATWTCRRARRDHIPAGTGHLLLDIGLALALSSLLGLILMLTAMPAALAYRIRIEEALLAAQFGDEWQTYVERTPYRVLPLLF